MTARSCIECTRELPSIARVREVAIDLVGLLHQDDFEDLYRAAAIWGAEVIASSSVRMCLPCFRKANPEQYEQFTKDDPCCDSFPYCGCADALAPEVAP